MMAAAVMAEPIPGAQIKNGRDSLKRFFSIKACQATIEVAELLFDSWISFKKKGMGGAGISRLRPTARSMPWLTGWLG